MTDNYLSLLSFCNELVPAKELKRNPESFALLSGFTQVCSCKLPESFVLDSSVALFSKIIHDFDSASNICYEFYFEVSEEHEDTNVVFCIVYHFLRNYVKYRWLHGYSANENLIGWAAGKVAAVEGRFKKSNRDLLEQFEKSIPNWKELDFFDFEKPPIPKSKPIYKPADPLDDPLIEQLRLNEENVSELIRENPPFSLLRNFIIENVNSIDEKSLFDCSLVIFIKLLTNPKLADSILRDFCILYNYMSYFDELFLFDIDKSVRYPGKKDARLVLCIVYHLIRNYYESSKKKGNDVYSWEYSIVCPNIDLLPSIAENSIFKYNNPENTMWRQNDAQNHPLKKCIEEFEKAIPNWRDLEFRIPSLTNDKSIKEYKKFLNNSSSESKKDNKRSGRPQDRLFREDGRKKIEAERVMRYLKEAGLENNKWTSGQYDEITKVVHCFIIEWRGRKYLEKEAAGSIIRFFMDDCGVRCDVKRTLANYLMGFLSGNPDKKVLKKVLRLFDN